MASSKLYAFAADGEVFPCQNPYNTALCQALLDKSETYVAEDKDLYRRKNYRDAAENVSILLYSLPHTPFEDWPKRRLWRFFGPRTTEFILDFCKKNPATAPTAGSIYEQLMFGSVGPQQPY